MREAPARSARLGGILALALGFAPSALAVAATWTNGNKQGLGTAIGSASPVWFTLGQGLLNEVYYPSVDRANLRSLQLVFADPQGRLEPESEAWAHQVVPEDFALVFEQRNRGRGWQVSRRVYTDPDRPVVRLDLELERSEPGRVFVLLDPALSNGASADRAGSTAEVLAAEDGSVALALASSCPLIGGFAESKGPEAALARLSSWPPVAVSTAPGDDLVLAAELQLGDAKASRCALALGFGSTVLEARQAALDSLQAPREQALARYRSGWQSWLVGLRAYDGPHPELYRASLMVLRALEDKGHAGAGIASLTVPWGDFTDASKDDVGGYHLVWSRDLYHVATALDAAGDRAGALRALDYLFRVQQRPDGSFPQNSWPDGRPFWPSVQLDEVAWPILLAEQLGRHDLEIWSQHVRPSAEYLLAHGPRTPQERWEEEGGYSPSTLAAQIAGLVAAAEIAERHSATADGKRYRETAAEWNRRIEEWTVTRTGPLSKFPYFVRIAQQGQPERGQLLEINNGGGQLDERSVVDAGFLELVRLGIRPADDPVIVSSLEVVDRVLRVQTPNGPGFYRYNGDGYGEKPDGRGWDGTGVGRLWPLLSGERGEYELAAGRDARSWLDTLAGFANEGRMLPEQVWDRAESPRPHLAFGEGTGGATPLAWTHAQFVRLALSLQRGRLVEQPESVKRFFSKPR